MFYHEHASNGLQGNEKFSKSFTFAKICTLVSDRIGQGRSRPGQVVKGRINQKVRFPGVFTSPHRMHAVTTATTRNKPPRIARRRRTHKFGKPHIDYHAYPKRVEWVVRQLRNEVSFLRSTSSPVFRDRHFTIGRHKWREIRGLIPL